jgi:CRP/FNR family cyclic AMP-dependent transcriptional regulator
MATANTAAVLATVDLFEGLSPRVLTEVAESMETVEFAAGESVVSQGDSVGGFKAFSRTGVNMHIVLEGSASVQVDGRPVGTLTSGEYFGELSLIDGEPRSADVVAEGEGLTTLALSKWAFAELVEQHPEVAVPMLKVMVARLRRAEASGSASD